jgi:hypothetical protein
MTEELKDAAIHILSTMWEYSKWQPISDLSKDYKQGVLQGLQHSLYSTILVAQRGKI